MILNNKNGEHVKMKNINNKLSKNNIENEKFIILEEIENAERKKANLLLNMGIMTYEKIRNEKIVDESFDNICDELLEVDKLIYNNNIKINKLEETSKDIICECGNILNSENNFCGICGKKIEIKNPYYNECKKCNTLNEDDSIYCICCGSKL